MFKFQLMITLLILGSSKLDRVLVSKCKRNQVLNHLMLLGAHPVILVGTLMWQMRVFADKLIQNVDSLLMQLRMKLSLSQCSHNSHTGIALRICFSETGCCH